MKKILNDLLLFSFVITNLVPLTGISIHKLSSVLFLLLCVIHTIVYRKQMRRKRWVLLGMILSSFVSGVLAMIMETQPLVLSLHKVISIAVVFFLAIHIFVFHRRLKMGGRKNDDKQATD